MFQEREYLRNFVCRLEELQPDVILVERAVSRVALELLLKTKIVVVANVKAVSDLHCLHEHESSTCIFTYREHSVAFNVSVCFESRRSHDSSNYSDVS